jgi:hypothetical protein
VEGGSLGDERERERGGRKRKKERSRVCCDAETAADAMMNDC